MRNLFFMSLAVLIFSCSKDSTPLPEKKEVSLIETNNWSDAEYENNPCDSAGLIHNLAVTDALEKQLTSFNYTNEVQAGITGGASASGITNTLINQ